MFVFTPSQRIEMKRNTKYNSECAICFYASFFHVVAFLLEITTQALKEFFGTRCFEIFNLLSKSFSHGSLNFFVACEVYSFIESCAQPEVGRCGATSYQIFSVAAEVAALLWRLA